MGCGAPENRLGSGDRGPLHIFLGDWIFLDSWKPLRVLRGMVGFALWQCRMWIRRMRKTKCACRTAGVLQETCTEAEGNGHEADSIDL